MYRNSHDKIRWSHLYDGNAHTWKHPLHIETGPSYLRIVWLVGGYCNTCAYYLSTCTRLCSCPHWIARPHKNNWTSGGNQLESGQLLALMLRLRWGMVGVQINLPINQLFIEIFSWNIESKYKHFYKTIQQNLKLVSAKWWPFCWGLNVLVAWPQNGWNAGTQPLSSSCMVCWGHFSCQCFVDTLHPGRCSIFFKLVTFKHIFSSIIDNKAKSTLIPAMAWCFWAPWILTQV